MVFHANTYQALWTPHNSDYDPEYDSRYRSAVGYNAAGYDRNDLDANGYDRRGFDREGTRAKVSMSLGMTGMVSTATATTTLVSIAKERSAVAP